MFRSLLASFAAAALLSVAGSAQATVLVYTADMNGASEVPSNASPATGFTTVTVDDFLDTMQVDVVYTGLIGGNPAAAHIHCCIAPGGNTTVAVGFPGFPATLSGSYSHLFNLLDVAIYGGGFLAAHGATAATAKAALLAGLADGQAYSNIHNAQFGGGEIRGLLTAVPEPGTWALLIAGFGLMGASLRRRRGAFA